MDAFSIVIIVGVFLSIFCYVGTIATYASFDELRNIPGMCLLNAATALLITTVIRALSEFVLFSGTLCVGVAVIEQLAWLATFTWMSLQAVHMVRTFVLTKWQTPVGHPLNRKQYAKVSLTHALIGWGLPALYTAVLVYLHFCQDCFHGDEEFRFGREVNSTEMYCWPGKISVTNHLSVDPMLILMAFNIVALLSIMVAIIKKRMETRKTAGRDLKNEIATNFFILIKLSISLGATWLPVLVNRISRHDFLLQIHYFLISWLGVIIFTLFTASQRIRRYWRGKLRGLCPSSKPGSASSNLFKLKESSASSRTEITS